MCVVAKALFVVVRVLCAVIRVLCTVVRVLCTVVSIIKYSPLMRCLTKYCFVRITERCFLQPAGVN